jgi:oligopeptide/dipeptide ABC transporter ATP-binding protein
VKTLLRVKNLVKHFPLKKKGLNRKGGIVRAVDGVSFNIFEGETLALVGESGCGKSTIGRTILRLLEPTSGSVYFQERDLFALKRDELRKMRKDMQIVFQDPFGSLNPSMKVKDIIAEPLVAHRIGNRVQRYRKVAELMHTVGLNEEHMERYPHEFSGGQRQRISIARALSLNPKFIVCDEAVSALDVSIQSQILNLLEELQERFGLTYLFISHDLSVVHHLSDRVGVMYLGKLVELAPVDRLFTKPAHPYTQALLSAIPEPDPEVKKSRILLQGDVPSPVNPPSGCRFHPRCPFAQDRCKKEEPRLQPLADGSLAACHFPLN